MLFQVACNQFLVIKKTWPNMLILSMGAVINVILNLILIPIIGIEGAAIATLSGYIISDIVCMIVLCRMKLMEVTRNFLIVSAITASFMLLWRLFFSNNVIIGTLTSFITVGMIMMFYQNEIKRIMNKLISKKSRT